MIASMSLPVGESSACSVMETTRIATPAEHGLEGDGVLALAGEAGELPDEDLLEGRVGLAGLVQHLAELWPVGDAATLGLIDVFARDEIAVLGGVVAQRPHWAETERSTSWRSLETRA